MLKRAALSIVLLQILLFQLLTGFIAVTSVSGETRIEIVSHKGFLTSLGYRVVGEVKNTGDQSVTNVTLKVSFYNSNNQIIRSIEQPVELEVLLPGRKSLFSIYLANQQEAQQVENYDITIFRFNECPDKPIGLEILWHKFDNVSIYGKIRNFAAKNTSNVVIFATFYDSNQKVADTSMGGLGFLQNKSDEIFEVYYPSIDVFQRDLSYSLTAESFDYAVKEETALTRLSYSSNESADIFYFFGTLIAISAIALIIAIVVARIKRKRVVRKKLKEKAER